MRAYNIRSPSGRSMMENSIKAILELGRAAVIVIENGKISHMNSPAIVLFGGDRSGESPAGLLPDHLLNESSPSFTTGASVNGHRCCAQVRLIEGSRYISFEEENTVDVQSGIFSRGIITDMSSTLFNIGMAIDRVREECQIKSKPLSDYLAILNHNYYNLRHNLSNLNTFIALREGSLPFRFTVTDLAKLCSEIVSTVSVICCCRGLDIEFSSRHGELFAYADGEKIERILLNLLSNSIAHTPRGGRIALSLEKSGDTAYISVDDNGSGIPAHEMTRLFTAYERQSILSSPDSFRGGLGLGIARSLAEAHNGAILIESREGEGCSVRLILPLKSERFTCPEAPEPDYVNSGMDLILTELAPVLDSECYCEKYLD